MIALKIYRQGIQLLVAACDEELLGQTFSEGVVNLQVLPSFYDDVRVNPDELAKALGGATMANLVGKNTIDVAVAGEFIAADGVALVDGVPHAQLVMI